MLKEEYKKALMTPPKEPKGIFKPIVIRVTSEEHAYIKKIAKECGCCMGDYFKRLHNLAQKEEQ